MKTLVMLTGERGRKGGWMKNMSVRRRNAFFRRGIRVRDITDYFNAVTL